MSKTARGCARRVKRDANSVWRSCHGVQNLALLQEANLFGSCLSPAAPIAAGLKIANA
jgi:hypothetical protein